MLVNETLGTELSTTVATAGSFVDWPGENVNLANRSAFADVAEGLHHQLLNSTNYQLRKCVCVSLCTATWAWVRGKCKEAMREVLGAGRGVQAGEVETPAMAAERQRREERRGGEQRAMRRATEAMGHKTASAYGYATLSRKPQAARLYHSPPV